MKNPEESIHLTGRGWSLVYEWHEGSVPPPHYYEFNIQLQSTGEGKITFLPDYPTHGPPAWVEAFSVPLKNWEQLEALISQMTASGQRSALDNGPVGGSTSHIEIFSEGAPAFVSGHFSEDAAGEFSALCQAVRDQVPAAIWEQLHARREMYWQGQL